MTPGEMRGKANELLDLVGEMDEENRAIDPLEISAAIWGVSAATAATSSRMQVTLSFLRAKLSWPTSARTNILSLNQIATSSSKN